MSKEKALFSSLRGKDWSKAPVSFYTVKRALRDRRGVYEVNSVSIDSSLRSKLKEILGDRLARSNGIRDYEYESSDIDENFLHIETQETEFVEVASQLSQSAKIVRAVNYEELVGSWMYIAEFGRGAGQDPLFAVRRVSDSWGTKKVRGYANLIFKDNMLVDLDEEEVFRIDNTFDFLVCGDHIYISNKKNFEFLLNFRSAMIATRDAFSVALEKRKVITDAKTLKVLVGDNTRRLRKLSKIEKSGHYKDKAFLKELVRVSKQEKWGIKFFENGEIEVTEDSIDTVLTVLNNDRLKSQINKVTFDVDVKNVVTK